MQKLFGLKSANTINWIVTGGTSKFFNQDIVQTTNYKNWLDEYNKLWKEFEPTKTKADYAKEFGVNYSSFVTRYNIFNKDLETTINYFKQLKSKQ